MGMLVDAHVKIKANRTVSMVHLIKNHKRMAAGTCAQISRDLPKFTRTCMGIPSG